MAEATVPGRQAVWIRSDVEDDMTRKELQEWLGLTLADGLLYLATAALIAMLLVSNRTLDIVLAVAGIGLAIAACPLGMKQDSTLSSTTNAFKMVIYPVCVLVAVVAVVIHFVWYAG